MKQYATDIGYDIPSGRPSGPPIKGGKPVKPSGNPVPITHGVHSWHKPLVQNVHERFSRTPPGVPPGAWLAANMELIGHLRGKNPMPGQSNWRKKLTPQELQKINYYLNENLKGHNVVRTGPDGKPVAEFATPKPFEQLTESEKSAIQDPMTQYKSGFQPKGNTKLEEELHRKREWEANNAARPPWLKEANTKDKTAPQTTINPLDQLDQITQARDIHGNEIKTADMLVSGGVKLQQNQRAEKKPESKFQFRNIGGQVRIVGTTDPKAASEAELPQSMGQTQPNRPTATTKAKTRAGMR